VHASRKLNRLFCSKHVADDYSLNDFLRHELSVGKNAFLSSKSHIWREALKSDRIDQRSICLFLALKGLSARAIDNKLTVVLGADVIADSIVTKYLRQRKFTSIFADPSEEPATIVIDQAIRDPIEQYPFSSIRDLARLSCIPTPTVH
jgi:hypothetical protein